MVTKETAVTIDTELASIYYATQDIGMKIASKFDNLTWYERSPERWATSIAQVKSEIEALKQSLVPLYERKAELDAIYYEAPWNRAYLVTSSNGHIHKWMDCSTCYASTQFYWLTEYSADTEETIVDAAGELACTVCYPSAPADVLNRPTKIVLQSKVEKDKARAEREEKRAARLAKQKAAAPTASGEPLLLVSYIRNDGSPMMFECKTERSAVSEWNSIEMYRSDNTRDYQLQNQRMIVEALAGKNGVSFDEQLKILQTKFAKRR